MHGGTVAATCCGNRQSVALYYIATAFSVTVSFATTQLVEYSFHNIYFITVSVCHIQTHITVTANKMFVQNKQNVQNVCLYRFAFCFSFFVIFSVDACVGLN